MAKGRKPKNPHKCCATKLDGTPCTRYGMHRVVELDLWLCSPHKKWLPPEIRQEIAEGKRAQIKSRKDYQERKRRFHHRRMKGAKTCFFTSKSGVPCVGVVVARLPDGRDCCNYHRQEYLKADCLDQDLMDQMAVDHWFKKRVNLIKRPDKNTEFSRLRVLNMPELEEQVQVLMEREQEFQANAIRFKGERRTIEAGTQKSAFYGIDVEYYTPQWEYEPYEILLRAIRRAEAQVNILFQQLQRIEQEEEQLKKIEVYGSQIVEGKKMDYENVTRRHATPIELKMKLIDNLTKAEAHYARLLKQMEDMPMVALMVMRRLGVRWDRAAAQMVINQIDQKNMKAIVGSGALEMEEAQAIKPLSVQSALELVSEDATKAKKLVELMGDKQWQPPLTRDDDW